MVNAIAPNAPIGATRMMMPTIANSTCDDLLDEVEHQRAAAAELVQAKPNSTANSSTCRISPLANASTTVLGMTFSRKSVVLAICPGFVYAAMPFGVERRGIDVHAGAGLHDVDDREADDQRDRADDLEIEQRIAAGLADLLHVLHAGDADDDRAEDDRRDDHLDQLDEAVAERLHRLAASAA